MRRIRRLALTAVGLLVLGAAVATWILLSDQSAKTRTAHINYTLAEINRGNYFAWGQVWMWMGRMTPAEEKQLTGACGHYALTNHVLHVTGINWPVEKASPNFRAWSVWVKDVVGIEDTTLAFDIIEYPPQHDIHMKEHESLFRLAAETPVAATAAFTPPTASPAR